ncbi:hypothetical protein SAMN05660745_02497 [Corynebacterium glucuronolyticum]|nr:hypothetical protein CGLUCO_03900 [Corynebacterium glucuronolyticum DSM 44120]SMB81867.1 hypothetical protein SAMN05660745_02497 [Corynebacterium glucuronolyticum]
MTTVFPKKSYDPSRGNEISEMHVIVMVSERRVL